MNSRKLLAANQRLHCVVAAIAMCLIMWPVTTLAGLFDAPLDTRGDFAYSYRSLNSALAGESISQQYRASLNVRSWLWQPWLATVNLGMRATLDNGETIVSGVSTGNRATILTGNLDLGILAQSRSPLHISYRASDSRVESFLGDNPLTGLGGNEYSSQRLAVKQRFFTESGQRLQAYYDNNRWQSGINRYDDWKIGADMSLRLPQQSLTARGSLQESRYSLWGQTSRTQVLNVDHFYYPGKALRIDSMANVYNFERQSLLPVDSNNQADSTTDLSQLSTTVFWRPVNRRLTVSGGVRLYDLGTVTADNNIAVHNMNATTGALYQYNKNLRFDANVDLSNTETDGRQVNVSSQRAGGLYQSDIYALSSGATWQWYSTAAARLRNIDSDLSATLDSSLGHDAQKIWQPLLAERWRLSLSQSGSGNYLQDNGKSIKRALLNHSVSLSWDRQAGSGMTMFQMTVADTRSFGGLKNNQQLINFQLTRNQNISRLRSLNGNLTLQYVRRDFNETSNSDTVTTATGQISYYHSRIMGVPRLRFVSDLRLSKAATDEFIDRGEWENRLDYVIGLLDARMSWRRTVLDSGNYDLIYFQVSRRY